MNNEEINHSIKECIELSKKIISEINEIKNIDIQGLEKAIRNFDKFDEIKPVFKYNNPEDFCSIDYVLFLAKQINKYKIKQKMNDYYILKYFAPSIVFPHISLATVYDKIDQVYIDIYGINNDLSYKIMDIFFENKNFENNSKLIDARYLNSIDTLKAKQIDSYCDNNVDLKVKSLTKKK